MVCLPLIQAVNNWCTEDEYTASSQENSEKNSEENSESTKYSVGEEKGETLRCCIFHAHKC